jgi:hypothetical protein
VRGGCGGIGEDILEGGVSTAGVEPIEPDAYDMRIRLES